MCCLFVVFMCMLCSDVVFMWCVYVCYVFCMNMLLMCFVDVFCLRGLWYVCCICVLLMFCGDVFHSCVL